MTKLTPEEDMAFLSPEQIEADIKATEIECVWKPRAEKLGLVWSDKFGVFTNRYDMLGLAISAEEACNISGYTDIIEAIERLENETTITS